jgi:hypothetical protein
MLVALIACIVSSELVLRSLLLLVHVLTLVLMLLCMTRVLLVIVAELALVLVVLKHILIEMIYLNNVRVSILVIIWRYSMLLLRSILSHLLLNLFGFSLIHIIFKDSFSDLFLPILLAIN